MIRDAMDRRRKGGSGMSGLAEPAGEVRDAMAHDRKEPVGACRSFRPIDRQVHRPVRPEATARHGFERQPDPRRTRTERLERPLQCTCYHSLFVFNQFGDLERCASVPATFTAPMSGRAAEAGRGALSRQGRAHLFPRRRGLRQSRGLRVPGGRAHQICDPVPANRVLQERIGHLLTRPVGRPPNEVRRFYANFTYQAGSWTNPPGVVAEVEWHPGELYPRVALSSPTWRGRPRMSSPSTTSAGREQWIKEARARSDGHGSRAARSPRTPCDFSFMPSPIISATPRTLATPEPIKDWSLDEPEGEADQDRREGRQPWPLCRFPDGRSRHSENLFADILRLIAELRPPPATSTGNGFV